MDFPIYSFGLGLEQPNDDTSAETLGGKGAGLMWMDKRGLPVPPGFILPTSSWGLHHGAPKLTMKNIAKAIVPYMAALKKHFGYMPLLSVRSGARVSCPGMMDTILNVGLWGVNYKEWADRLGDACVQDSYARLITMYGSVVDGLPRAEMEKLDWMEALAYYHRKMGKEFPERSGQMMGSIEAVFKSWSNERAKIYRKLNQIPDHWGTAVTVQAMVFGNMNEQSGTGVLFTRNPDTGEDSITGEFLEQAQGEDVVAGIRTPVPLINLKYWNPTVFDQLVDTVTKLEVLKRDVQDVEFTVQDGKLYLLQTRNAKRSARAAIKIALDMVQEQLITPKEMVGRVTGKQFDLAQQVVLDPTFDKQPFLIGIPACSGVVTGKAVFSAQEAIDSKVPCILVTQETTPDDIAGMYAARGIVTMTGGATSHAAVVARGMNKPCIVGVGYKKLWPANLTLSIDGATGRIWQGEVPVIAGDPEMTDRFKSLLMEALGVLPVITSAPSKPMPQALLSLGEEIVDAKRAVATVLAALRQVDRLYLDLSPPSEEERSRQIFRSILGDARLEEVLVLMLSKLAKTVDLDFLLSKLVIIGKVKSEFKTVASVSDLRDLVLAQQEVVLTGFGLNDPAVQQVLQWKQAEGLQYLALGVRVHGSKSFLSVEQALQEAGS